MNEYTKTTTKIYKMNSVVFFEDSNLLLLNYIIAINNKYLTTKLKHFKNTIIFVNLKLKSSRYYFKFYIIKMKTELLSSFIDNDSFFYVIQMNSSSSSLLYKKKFLIISNLLNS
jgi:hypothetical protein